MITKSQNKRDKKYKNVRLFPLLREEVSPRNKRMYIGSLITREFDLIDLCRQTGRPMSFGEIGQRVGNTEDTVSRYFRMMQASGTMGLVKTEEIANLETITGAAHRFGATCVDFDIVRTRERHLVGPTMVGLMLWHWALNEEWDWESYVGRQWISY